MVDIDVGWAHLVPGGLRELDEHLGRAARVDDLEVAADAPEQACGTPTIQGVATSVEHYIPLIHGVCFLVASLLREDRKEAELAHPANAVFVTTFFANFGEYPFHALWWIRGPNAGMGRASRRVLRWLLPRPWPGRALRPPSKPASQHP